MTEKNEKKEIPKAKGKKVKEKKDKKQDVKQEDLIEDKKEEKGDDPGQQKILPPLDFSSLVLPFFTQGLIELGETEHAEAKNTEENLKLTQRLIDLLDMLKEKTKGNLKPEEEIFLDQCLHQLRMAYMERAKIITL
jgi:hypothetical protein